MDKDFQNADMANANPKSKSVVLTLPGTFARLPATDPLRSLLEIFQLLKTDWSRSYVGIEVTRFFHRKILTRQNFGITEAICVGLGGFMFRCQDYREKSFGQLAAFVYWVDLLSK